MFFIHFFLLLLFKTTRCNPNTGISSNNYIKVSQNVLVVKVIPVFGHKMYFNKTEPLPFLLFFFNQRYRYYFIFTKDGLIIGTVNSPKRIWPCAVEGSCLERRFFLEIAFKNRVVCLFTGRVLTDACLPDCCFPILLSCRFFFLLLWLEGSSLFILSPVRGPRLQKLRWAGPDPQHPLRRPIRMRYFS